MSVQARFLNKCSTEKDSTGINWGNHILLSVRFIIVVSIFMVLYNPTVASYCKLYLSYSFNLVSQTCINIFRN